MKEKEIDITKNRDELKEKIEADGRMVAGSRMYKDMDFAKDEESLHTSFDVIFVQEKLEDGKAFYEIFDSQKNRIGTADASGKITYDEEFKEKCKDIPLDLEENARELIEKNKEKEFKDDNKEKSGYDDKLHKKLDEEKKPEEEGNPEQEEENPEQEGEEKEDIKDKENLKDEELSEAISKDMGEDVKAFNVMDAKMKVGEDGTLESKIGSPDKYDKFAVVQVNGQFEMVGLSKETGKYESVEGLKKVDDTNYDVKVARGDGKFVDVKTRNLFRAGGENEGIAINQDGSGTVSIASVKYDEEGKKAYGTELPETRAYVQSAVDNGRDGSKSATRMAETEEKLKQETGKEADNIMDITHDGEIANSVDNKELIKLSDGSYTTIEEEAEKYGYTTDEYRGILEDRTTDSVADAIEDIRKEKDGNGRDMIGNEHDDRELGPQDSNYYN